MMISDFLFGLEFFAIICTLIFILALLAEAPILNSIATFLRATFASASESAVNFELYYTENMKRSLLNQQVAPRT